MVVNVGSRHLTATESSSWIHHETAQTYELDDVKKNEIFDGTAREIVQDQSELDAPYLAVIVIFSVLSLTVICALVIAVVMYRRKTTGQYPKSSQEDLAFSSPMYGYYGGGGHPYVNDIIAHKFGLNPIEHDYDVIKQNKENEFANVHK